MGQRRGCSGGSASEDRVADMASSRVPQQLFLQGVAAVYLFAFASLYTQIPGEGAQGGTLTRGIIPSFALLHTNSLRRL